MRCETAVNDCRSLCVKTKAVNPGENKRKTEKGSRRWHGFEQYYYRIFET